MQRNRETYKERFNRKNGVHSDCTVRKTSSFLTTHLNSTQITVNRTEENLDAVLIFTDQEGADEVLLYVSKEADFIVNDYFTWDSLTFFAYEKVQVVHSVSYVQYKVLQCNVFVNDSFWAYFKSSLRSAHDTTLTNKTEFSTTVPLLVAPINGELKIGGSIIFNNQTWDIEDGDIFTINGIGYYYLSRGMNSRDNEEYEPEDEMDVYYVGQPLSIPTTNGYYVANNVKVKLKERAFDKVVILPLEEGNLEIITVVQGEQVTRTFLIKENV